MASSSNNFLKNTTEISQNVPEFKTQLKKSEKIPNAKELKSLIEGITQNQFNPKSKSIELLEIETNDNDDADKQLIEKIKSFGLEIPNQENLEELKTISHAIIEEGKKNFPVELPTNRELDEIPKSSETFSVTFNEKLINCGICESKIEIGDGLELQNCKHIICLMCSVCHIRDSLHNISCPCNNNTDMICNTPLTVK